MKKFKFRLVDKEFHQELGVNFKETFLPVSKGVSFRVAVALALRRGLKM